MDTLFGGSGFQMLHQDMTCPTSASYRKDDHPLQFGGAIVRRNERGKPDCRSVKADKEPHHR